MIDLKTPRGLPVSVPASEAEDPSPRFQLSNIADALSYYRIHGYVVFKSLIAWDKCEEIKRLWHEEVKPSRSYIYRQATAKAERHLKNDQGWVVNPILNLQSVCPREFRRFRQFSTDKIITDSRLVSALEAILGDRPKIVQSMYFEGNSATWEHQDTYYLDSTDLGSMCGAWIALENIEPEAGRFFVCDRSHLIDMGLHSSANNIADNHDAYIQSVVDVVREKKLEIRAPALRRGDVLFWNSKTIHGSLDTQDAGFSRSSITVHAIPEQHQFLQLQNRIKRLDLRSINGIPVHHPKDLASPANRAVMWVESRYPTLFYGLKRAAVRAAIWRGRTFPITSPQNGSRQ